MVEIIRIFDERLFSIKNEGEKNHELRRCLESWNDATYIHQFLKANKNDLRNRDIFTASEQIIEDVAELQWQLNKLGTDPYANFESMFVALDNNEYRPVVLSKRKKRSGYLRLYAIRIDQNCFVITGGAIKLTKRMDEREHTAQELQKLAKVREMLRRNGISDAASFFEWINES